MTLRHVRDPFVNGHNIAYHVLDGIPDANLRAMPKIPVSCTGAADVIPGPAAPRQNHIGSSTLTPILLFVVAFIWRWRKG